MPASQVILDTDIGSDIDDALALLLLLNQPDVDLRGITTVYGKVGVRAAVARKIVALAGRDVPVLAGAAFPLRPAFPVWHTGTEGDGLLTAAELAAAGAATPAPAEMAAFMVEQFRQYPGAITLIGIGALTNVATALEAEPRLAGLVKELVFMGAGVTHPDPLPDPCVAGTEYRARRSHNVGCDVEAAQRVFASRLPIRVLTNDVTTAVWWDGRTVQWFMDAARPPEAVAVGKLLRVWLDYRTAVFGRPITGTCPHDPLTVAEALVPGRFVRYVRGRVRIHDNGDSTFVTDPEGPHQVGIGIDSGRFLDWFFPQLMGRHEA